MKEIRTDKRMPLAEWSDAGEPYNWVLFCETEQYILDVDHGYGHMRLIDLTVYPPEDSGYTGSITGIAQAGKFIALRSGYSFDVYVKVR